MIFQLGPPFDGLPVDEQFGSPRDRFDLYITGRTFRKHCMHRVDPGSDQHDSVLFVSPHGDISVEDEMEYPVGCHRIRSQVR